MKNLNFCTPCFIYVLPYLWCSWNEWFKDMMLFRPQSDDFSAVGSDAVWWADEFFILTD